MHVFVIIIACLSGTLAAGCLFAGYLICLMPDDQEMVEFNQRFAELKKKGFRGELEAYSIARGEVLNISRIVSHWRNRPDVRQLIWVGLLSGVISLGAAQFL